MLGLLAVVSGRLEFIVAFWYWRKLVDFEEVLPQFYELMVCSPHPILAGVFQLAAREETVWKRRSR